MANLAFRLLALSAFVVVETACGGGSENAAMSDGAAVSNEGSSRPPSVGRTDGSSLTDSGNAPLSDASNSSAPDVAGPAPIVRHGTVATVFQRDFLVVLSVPNGAQPNDLLLGGIVLGDLSATTPPTLTPPPGWQLVSRIDDGNTSTLAVYWGTNMGDAATLSWSFSDTVGGVAWISAYGGVDVATPVFAQSTVDYRDGGTTFSTPTIMAVPANYLVVASYGGLVLTPQAVSWSGPASMNMFADLYDGIRRSGMAADAIQTASGAAGPYAAMPSVHVDDALVHLLALKPR
jgi:hypothetical protein